MGIQILTFGGRVSEWAGSPEVVFADDMKKRRKVYLPDDPHLYGAMNHEPFTAFSHPRVVVDRFDLTEQALKKLMQRMGPRWSPAKPIFIMHVQQELDGGLSGLERMALIQLGRSLGANVTLVVTSTQDLSPPDLLQIARRREDVLALDA